MTEKVLLSTAYLPPIQYFSLIEGTSEVFIEREENYLKQTYRNRCHILSANGPLSISVPVKRGSIHKTQIKDIEIDYSKRWQSVHLMAITSAYRSSAFFEYYFDRIERVIGAKHRFLLDLNMAGMTEIVDIIGISPKISYTSYFEPVCEEKFDYRYLISPKIKLLQPEDESKKYFQLFPGPSGFVPNLSIIDLIFNTGPDSISHL